jgi:hypothetical protein
MNHIKDEVKQNFIEVFNCLSDSFEICFHRREMRQKKPRHSLKKVNSHPIYTKTGCNEKQTNSFKHSFKSNEVSRV